MATGHGNTPAAWTGVTIMFVGCVVGAVAVIIADIPLLFVGIGIVVLGAIVGGVMTMMGLGAKQDRPERQPAGQHQAAGH